MKKRADSEVNAAERRKALAKDLEQFLQAGNQIQQIPDGVSAQDPTGRPRGLRLKQPDPPAEKSSSKGNR